MTPKNRIVLLAGSAVDPSTLPGVSPNETFDALQPSTGSARSSVALISLVRTSTPLPGIMHITLEQEREGVVERIFTCLGLVALFRWMRKFPAGRLIASFGPMDPSRVFRRAVRRSREAMAAINSATVVIAVDLPAVRTAWDAVHSGRVPRGLHDLPAAIRELRA